MVELVIVHGPDGAGKSTQAKLLASAHSWHYLSTGDLCRASKDPVVQADLAKGKLITSAKLQDMLGQALSSLEGTVVLDGSPRKLSELDWLDAMFEKGVVIKKAVIVRVSEEISKKRLKNRGRNSDTHEGITTRLQWFKDETTPVIQELTRRGLVVEVDGSGSPGQVQKGIEEAICVPS